MSVNVQIYTTKVLIELNDHPRVELPYDDFKMLAEQIRAARVNLLGYLLINMTIDLVQVGDLVMGREVMGTDTFLGLTNLELGPPGQTISLLSMPSHEVIEVERRIE